MNNASKKTILLVEDEALIAMAEKMSLERYGYDVDTARTGEQAVEFFQTGRSVDLILMDIDLGAGIDGTQAAETILQDHDIPVVFLSSHTEPEIVEKTEKITSYGYVVKSSSITVLDASIKMAFRLFESKTKEEKKEQALRESEYRYRMLFENMNASFALHEMIYDDNGDPIDYRFLDVNPFFEQDTGITAEAIIGRTAKELFPNTEQYWIDTFGKVAKTGESISYQNYSQEFDRYYDSYVFSPRRNQFAAFFIDITKFKQASEALEESEARFRVAQEVSPDGFTILHPVRNESNEIIDFAVRYQNSAIARVSGTDPQGVIGQHLLQLFPDHRNTPVFEAYLHVANTGETLVIEEMSVGEILSKSTWLRLVVVSMGSEIAILAQDITERKQVEAELLQINDELLKAKERAQESEERTRYILKHNPNAIAVFDNQMNLLIVSDRFLEDYNVEDTDIIGRNHYEIFPDIPERWRKVHEEALQGEVLSNDDDYFVRLDGSITYSRWECRPWYRSDNRIGGMIAYTEVITKRKQAEEELRRFKIISDNAVYGNAIADLQGKLLYVNRFFANIHGYEPDDVLGRHFSLFHNEEQIDAARNLIAIMVQEGSFKPSTVWHCHRDGTVFPMLMSGILLKDENGDPQYIAASAVDLSSQTQVEEKYRSLFNYSNDAIFVHEIGDDNLPGKNIEVNEQAVRLLGYTKEKLLTISARDVVPEKDASAMSLNAQELLVRKHLTFEAENIRSDGVVIPVEVSAHLYSESNKKFVVSSVRDISKRKQAEEALKASATRYDDLVAQIPVGVYVLWTRANGRKEFEYVSDPWCAIHGLRREDAIADAVAVDDLVHPEDQERFLECNRESARNRTPFRWEGRFFTGDGELRQLRIESTPVVIESGDIKWFGVTQDITERKQAEVEIRKQLTEKETLLREVHHRVKNNIGSIEGLLTLQAGSTDNPEAKVVLQDAISQIQSTRILYEKLLIAEEYQRTAIRSYTESIVDSLRNVFDSERKIGIEKDIRDFEMDAKRALSVGIIVNELLTNAFKYAFGDRDGGTVSVSIDKEESRVTLVIQDDGCGFDERTMENESPGFGFTIVRMLVEQLDGTFSIANEDGAKVVVRFEV